MDVIDRQVLTVLDRHQGAENGIKSQDLCRALSMCDRTLRHVIQRLVIDHRQRIGSHPTYGFFIIRPNNAHDRDLAIEGLEPRVKSLCVRLAVLKGIPVERAVEQMELFADDDPA